MTDFTKELLDLKKLERSRLIALRAWERFDTLHDKLFAQYGDKSLPQTVSESDVSHSESFAIHIQNYYFTLYYLMNDCTCTPNSVTACDVCQAKIKSKSIYREEM